MMYKKISLGLLLTVFGYANQLFVMDQTIDAEGRTPLMSYVKQQENQLKKLADAFYNKEYEINKLKAIVSHSAENNEDLDDINSILQKSILQLQKLDTKYDAMLKTTLEEIVKMIQAGVDLSATDTKNNTVLHLCETKEIYETLRANGAPFQFDTWMKFIEKPYLSTVLHIALASYLVYAGINGKEMPSPFFTVMALHSLNNINLYN